MAGKFLKRGAIIDVLKSQERTNAIQKREGLDRHLVTFILCGCPDPNCGGWHTIDAEHQVPSAEDCAEIIRSHNADGKADETLAAALAHGEPSDTELDFEFEPPRFDRLPQKPELK
jgi:hypothetical protein